MTDESSITRSAELKLSTLKKIEVEIIEPASMTVQIAWSQIGNACVYSNDHGLRGAMK